MTNIYRIGTRGSQLALAQTQEVIDQLKVVAPKASFEIYKIKTRGDLKPDVALTALGSNGLFVREVETALFQGKIDFAVHSLKDLPAKLGDHLTIAAVPKRGLPQDVLAVKDPSVHTLADLPKGAVIGTGSPRRMALMQHMRPDVTFLNIRGNVPTRLKKMVSGDYDALILAAAGLQRLGLDADPDVSMIALPLPTFIPAPGQGMLAVECVADNQTVTHLLGQINDAATFRRMRCERSFLQALNGDCTIPLGCYSEIAPNGDIQAQAFLGDKDDLSRTAFLRDAGNDPIALGQGLAKKAQAQLAKGAKRL